MSMSRLHLVHFTLDVSKENKPINSQSTLQKTKIIYQNECNNQMKVYIAHLLQYNNSKHKVFQKISLNLIKN